MRLRALLPAILLPFLLAGQEVRQFRQWVGGEEVGGSTLEMRKEGSVQVSQNHVWMTISRLGVEVRQDVQETARRSPDGRLSFTWRVQLSEEPYEGTAEWSPDAPGILHLRPSHGSPVDKPVPAGALLWPGDLEARLRQAARQKAPVTALTFSFATQQWDSLDLRPVSADPLPGFPDAIHYLGQEVEGKTRVDLESWISPEAGEVRQSSRLGASTFLLQRKELPPLAGGKATEGFFEQTLQTLPPDAFLYWRPEVILRVEGDTTPLQEDAQQRRLPDGRWRLVRAAPPTAAEAAEPPVHGAPSAGDAPYLAATPLVPFKDPAFDGLLRRMALPEGLSRWALARRVTSFVFDWITETDLTVGFASALEVCRHPRGDCTEHGVLAVALLRRLGVPARGVTGWVALDGMSGMHFWVEVKVGSRWVPVDPTFDQAPATAFRLKLADSDLADLGSVMWEDAATALSRMKWVPEGLAAPRIDGDRLVAPDGCQLRLPGGKWTFHDGRLALSGPPGGPWKAASSLRPDPAQAAAARHMAGARSGREGWWDPSTRTFWMRIAPQRWLRLEGVQQGAAFALLDQLLAASSSSED